MPAPFKDKWAILVGATEYKYVPKLQFARRDVIDLAAKLQDPLGFQSDHILPFHEESHWRPERDTVFTKLAELRDGGKVKPDHLVLFFFSGHGMQLGGKDYLITPNAGPKAPKLAIKVEDLVEDLNLFGCNNIVMFIDACRQNFEGAKSISGVGPNTMEAAKRTGIVTFFSCDPSDLSYEIEEYKHGSFTQGLLQAIEQGDITTVDEINTYLQAKVPEINRQAHKPLQQPYAVVEPLEKKNLEIFHNPKSELYWDQKYRPLAEKLCLMLQREDLQLWLNIVEFLDAVKKVRGKVSSSDTGLIAAVESYTQSKLTAGMLKLVWEMNQRERLGGPAAVAPQIVTIAGKPQSPPANQPMGIYRGPGPKAPVRIFCAYSHEDEKLRESLAKHLSPLQREGLVELWFDRRIGPGKEWEKEIDVNLESAGIILLLVSPGFMASDYCYDREVKRALERHESGSARVIPVILRPVDWGRTPIAKLQALPKDGKPVTQWINEDEAFVDVAKGIRQATS